MRHLIISICIKLIPTRINWIKYNISILYDEVSDDNNLFLLGLLLAAYVVILIEKRRKHAHKVQSNEF